MSDVRASLSDMTIDPLFSLLVGALGAGSLTVSGALLGAWLQARREHGRWVRERRFEAYLEFLRIVERHPKLSIPAAEFDAYLNEVVDAKMTVMLVGPDRVEEAATRHEDALGALVVYEELEPTGKKVKDDAWEEYREGLAAALDSQRATRNAFLRAAQRELRIRP